MLKTRKGISFRFIFYTILLYLFVYTHSVSFYILEKSKESNDSSKSTSVSFNITGGVDQGFIDDKYFKIKTEIYNDMTLLATKNTECKIAKSPQASFGTFITANCEIDLISSQNANNIKFIDFLINENDDLKVIDNKKIFLGNIFSFSKKIEINFDIEFLAESIDFIKCLDDKYIFSIKGEFSSIFIRGFTFDFILNDNEQLKAKCESPDIFVSKEVSINCTLIMLKDDKFKEDLKKGIELKESYYNTVNINNEKKLLKIKTKNNEKIVVKEITCNVGGIYDYFKNIFAPNKPKEEINKEEDEQKKWERQREEERRRQKEQEEREREEAKRKRDQDDLENLLRKREKEKEEQEKKRNNENDYNRIKNIKIDENPNIDDDIDYRSNVKLIHLQVRYNYGFIYYMFYALTPVPTGHKIKVRFSITKYNYDSGYNNQEYKYIILKADEGINANDRNIIVEYSAKYDCEQCKKMNIDKNSIQGATVYNIPDDQYFLDAISTNKNTYLSKSSMQNPPLYITDNIFSQNCMLYLSGHFFNKNTFFASKFSLNLIGTGYYNSRNVTVYCGLNERSIFACPINTNLNNFEYKLDKLVIGQKDNIIVDNSYYAKDGMTNYVNCQMGTTMQNINEKPQEILQVKKGWNWKRIVIIIIVIIVLYYLISKYYCEKEEEYSDEYNSRWRVSSSNYSGGGETYGLRSRGW